MKTPGGAFRSLVARDFRVWSIGSLISNTGIWMQRIAQHWLVFTQLTNHDARAVGVLTALQFGPQLLMLPWSGTAVDRYDRRKLMMIVQASMAVLAVLLGTIVLSGIAHLWHVYLLAFLMGCCYAFDAPLRQIIVTDIVPPEHLSNAVGLTSSMFNLSRMLGPALAGVLIAVIGTGLVLVLTIFTYAASIIALAMLRDHRGPQHHLAADEKPGGMIEGMRYVWHHPELKVLMLMLALFGSLGLNFPIFISVMSVSVFHLEARGFGMLVSAMAVGSVIGALIAAQRSRTTFPLLIVTSAIFGLGCALAGAMPSVWPFAVLLFLTGIASQTFGASSNALIQMETEPRMRGRVMALMFTIATGGQPIGAPFVGWIAHNFGPRWSLGVGAFAGFAVALLALAFLWLNARRSAREAAAF